MPLLHRDYLLGTPVSLLPSAETKELTPEALARWQRLLSWLEVEDLPLEMQQRAVREYINGLSDAGCAATLQWLTEAA